MATPLLRADILSLSGPDTAVFAHAQFTSDVQSLALHHWHWSAWLDAQGRARAVFALLRIQPQRYLAWLPLGGAQAMRDALARFVMRSAVTLDVVADWTLHRLDAGEAATPLSLQSLQPLANGFAFAQAGARHAWIAPVGAVPTDPPALLRWRLDDIAAHLPLLPPELAGEFVPQALDLERIDAIRFDKGCYPGQEIAARLHFRGGNKRRLRRLRVEDADVAAATRLLDDDGASIGQILYAAPLPGRHASDALAVLTDAHPGTRQIRTAGGIAAKIYQ